MSPLHPWGSLLDWVETPSYSLSDSQLVGVIGWDGRGMSHSSYMWTHMNTHTWIYISHSSKAGIRQVPGRPPVFVCLSGMLLVEIFTDPNTSECCHVPSVLFLLSLPIFNSPLLPIVHQNLQLGLAPRELQIWRLFRRVPATSKVSVGRLSQRRPMSLAFIGGKWPQTLQNRWINIPWRFYGFCGCGVSIGYWH